jgi:outer membrane protein OmpA-like peptidoglycan-associated protein
MMSCALLCLALSFYATVSQASFQTLYSKLQQIENLQLTTDRDLLLLRLDCHEQFEFGTDTLTRDAWIILHALAQVLRESSELDIMLIGYSDSSGDAHANLQLSTDRAYAARTVFLQDSVDPEAILAIGRGEIMPVYTEAGSEDHLRSRRVEIWLRDRSLLIGEN